MTRNGRNKNSATSALFFLSSLMLLFGVVRVSKVAAAPLSGTGGGAAAVSAAAAPSWDKAIEHLLSLKILERKKA